MVIESLNDFAMIAYYPHLYVYLFYLINKWCVLLCLGKRTIPQGINYNTYIVTSLFSLMSCCCFCFCCCCCCCCKPNLLRSAAQIFFRSSEQLNRFLIKLLFGPKEGMVERFAGTYKKDDVDGNGITRLFFHGKEIGLRDVSKLSLLILTFGLLAAVTAWDTYFLDKSFICTERPDINCFPVSYSDFVNSTNLTNAQKHRITNCSYWTSEEMSGLVTFQCFRWVFDSKSTISAIGGLLTLFVITVRILSSSSLACLSWMIQKCSRRSRHNRHPEVGEFHQVDYSKSIKYLGKIRKLIVIPIAVFEGLFGTTLVILTFLAETGINDNVISFFYTYGSQLLLIFGIFTTFLLLPLEEYAIAGEVEPSIDNHTERTPLLLSNQPARGGSQSARGGSQPARGGSQPARGGSQSARGGSLSARGGSQSARGGSQSARGGSQSARGGSQSARGGSQPARGGSQSARGGSQSARGGSQSARGGSQLARGGSQSARGGW